MKKIWFMILTGIMMFSFCSMVACENESTNDSPNINVSTNNDSGALTESKLKEIAVKEIYYDLIQKSSYGSWNRDIDPANCRFNIGSIRQVGLDTYEVNGICYFYDKYGSLTQYKYGSGDYYSKSFTVKIDSSEIALVYWD